MGFSRQEYWSGLPFPLQGDLPDSGIEPMSLKSPALTGGFFITSTNKEAYQLYRHIYNAICSSMDGPRYCFECKGKPQVLGKK